MRRAPGPGERLVQGWLDFWFGRRAEHTLAVLRIGVGLVLLYSLFIHSFDLAPHFAAQGWGELEALAGAERYAWPFSLFDWAEGTGWLWTVHLTALVVAAAFTLGVAANLTGALALVFYLSYLHRNPGIYVGLDGLLLIALAYLAVAPCGRVLALAPLRLPRAWSRPRPTGSPFGEPAPAPPPWGSLVLRVVQIHLCLLYFLGGLHSLRPDWLSGRALLHPRLLARDLPLAGEAMQASPGWALAAAHVLTLLALFYGVFVWMRGFRYPVLALLALAHLVVAVMWGSGAFNLLMVVLNLAFVSEEHLEWLRLRAQPLLGLPWLPTAARP